MQISSEILNNSGKKTFVSLFIDITNNLLIKDVGMLPYEMQKEGGYWAALAGYTEGKKFPYIDQEVKGLNLLGIKKWTGKPTIDGMIFLAKNAKKIDVLQLNHISTTWNRWWIFGYKLLNPQGKVYLKLDTNYDMVHFKQKKWQLRTLKRCDLVSAEIEEVAALLSEKWHRKVLYVPDGTYEENKEICQWKNKENIILTVGRIGAYQKATNVAFEGFRRFVNKGRKDWRLSVVGPIEQGFYAYMDKFFQAYPYMKEKIEIVGEMADRNQLEQEYAKAKIFLLTSRWESFGIVLAEAMKKGCYIVSTKVDSIEDITSFGKYGCYYAWKDAIHDSSEVSISHICDLVAEKLSQACNREASVCEKCCLDAQEYARKKFEWDEIVKPVVNELKKTKIAFIKRAGLGTGGTEKFMQTVSALLPKDEFEVDFYYSKSENALADAQNYEKLSNAGVHLIEFAVEKEFLDYKGRMVNWGKNNFFEVFSKDYDLIQTARSGPREYPFCKIKNIPIIDSLHYVGAAYNQYNIARVMHISRFSKKLWIKRGGDAKRTVDISHPMEIPTFEFTDIREEFGLSRDTFLFGMHQRDCDGIFSEIPLLAYKEVENDRNAFVICGGSSLYREQAKKLGLKNCYFIDHTSSTDEVYSFLASLDVYAHGRKDGELNSCAIAEALSMRLPVITHPSEDFNGHLEIIDGNGFVAKTVEAYAKAMKTLESNAKLREDYGEQSYRIFLRRYSVEEQMANICRIYRETVKNPYPHPIRRCLFALKDGIKFEIGKLL